MKAAAALLLVLLAGCTPTPVPDAGPPPAPPSPLSVAIYGELVEAGCMAASAGGPSAVQAEFLLDAGAPKWLSCLYDAGTPSSCGVPCSK